MLFVNEYAIEDIRFIRGDIIQIIEARFCSTNSILVDSLSNIVII